MGLVAIPGSWEHTNQGKTLVFPVVWSSEVGSVSQNGTDYNA